VLIQEGVGKIDWEEEVHRNVIWCYGFSLTKAGYLPKEVIDKLEEYQNDY
jgi:hypothetical protein